MTLTQKQHIKATLESYVARYSSQNKAANSLSGVSAATISQVLNNNWEKIADDMWRKISSQIGVKKEWEAVETGFFQTFTALLTDAQTNSFVYAVTAEAGSGKSFTCRHFAAMNRNVYHIVGCEAWSLQAFLCEILRQMGLERKSSNNDNLAMLGTIIKELKKRENPLLIFDEADKLSSKILYSLITLYNQLEESCGIIICATEHLEKKIVKGVEFGRLGFNELYSRIGRKFINIPVCSVADITAICAANGIDNADTHAEISNDSQGDLRRVKRLVHSFKNRG